jgi:sporulation protein YlmC with PRC-barrel domain
VDCADVRFGELADVVIDPGTRRVTHLVVQPHQRHDLARLVAIGRAQKDAGSGDRISLDYTVGQLNEVEPLHDFAYVRLGERPPTSNSDVGIQEFSQLPLSGSLGVNALGAGMEPLEFDDHGTVSYDRIPKGTVEVRRASQVTSSDGRHVGHVVGFVIDERQQIAELIVEHGHLWGKREIAIPIGSIDRIESDEVVLAVSHGDVVG